LQEDKNGPEDLDGQRRVLECLDMHFVDPERANSTEASALAPSAACAGLGGSFTPRL
jgi:hypothetical protein